MILVWFLFIVNMAEILYFLFEYNGGERMRPRPAVPRS